MPLPNSLRGDDSPKITLLPLPISDESRDNREPLEDQANPPSEGPAPAGQDQPDEPRRGRKRPLADGQPSPPPLCSEPDPEDRDSTHDDDDDPAAELEDTREDDECSRDREVDVSRQVLELSLDSPSSQAKRSRISPTASAEASQLRPSQPDAVADLIDELQTLIEYVAEKPSLHDGSASFMRDYLRTLVAKSSSDAVLSYQRESQTLPGPQNLFEPLPQELTKHVFSFLGGADLAMCSGVCRLWNSIASEESQWKKLCLQKWKSLETDKALWRLLDRDIDPEDPQRWRKIYPAIINRPQWKCRLQKTGRFICMMKAFHIRGGPLGENGLPKALVVERRFNWSHLQTFVLSDASVLYYEPDTEQDSAGFRDFTEYLVKRTRAGLALEDDRRYIFIPPCEFSKRLDYHGPSLLGIAQSSTPQTQ